MEQRDAFVYILISISKFCSLHKSESQNITTLFFIVHIYNSKSITLIENLRCFNCIGVDLNDYYGFIQLNHPKTLYRQQHIKSSS